MVNLDLTYDKKDLYGILDVDPDASMGQIKKAYRRLVKKYHPDYNDHPNADAVFRDLTLAYQILSDENKRANYDRYGFDGINGPTIENVIQEVEDIFNNSRITDEDLEELMYTGKKWKKNKKSKKHNRIQKELYNSVVEAGLVQVSPVPIDLLTHTPEPLKTLPVAPDIPEANPPRGWLFRWRRRKKRHSGQVQNAQPVFVDLSNHQGHTKRYPDIERVNNNRKFVRPGTTNVIDNGSDAQYSWEKETWNEDTSFVPTKTVNLNQQRVQNVTSKPTKSVDTAAFQQEIPTENSTFDTDNVDDSMDVMNTDSFANSDENFNADKQEDALSNLAESLFSSEEEQVDESELPGFTKDFYKSIFDEDSKKVIEEAATQPAMDFSFENNEVEPTVNLPTQMLDSEPQKPNSDFSEALFEKYAQQANRQNVANPIKPPRPVVNNSFKPKPEAVPTVNLPTQTFNVARTGSFKAASDGGDDDDDDDDAGNEYFGKADELTNGEFKFTNQQFPTSTPEERTPSVKLQNMEIAGAYNKDDIVVNIRVPRLLMFVGCVKNFFYARKVRCHFCIGNSPSPNGFVNCAHCNGTTIIEEKTEISVELPVTSEMLVTKHFPGFGNINIKNNMVGDLVINFISPKKDEYFWADQNGNLYTVVHVDGLKMSLTNYVRIHTLYGMKKISLTEINTDERIVIQDCGLKKHYSEKLKKNLPNGSLIIDLIFEFYSYNVGGNATVTDILRLRNPRVMDYRNGISHNMKEMLRLKEKLVSWNEVIDENNNEE